MEGVKPVCARKNKGKLIKFSTEIKTPRAEGQTWTSQIQTRIDNHTE